MPTATQPTLSAQHAGTGQPWSIEDPIEGIFSQGERLPS